MNIDKIRKSVGIIGNSPLIEEMLGKISQVASTDISVLITGAKEAVLGKDLPGKNHKETKLINLAYARSGDKGDHANIGVIARDPEFLPYIRYSLTIDRLKDYFGHVLKGDIQCWEVPGIYGLNFLLRHSLGGGGMASLNIDPQGKAYAQQILDLKILVSENIFNRIHKK